ncbi:acetylornithine deacetylase [Granulosicoccus antarcticus]|uniref:acetylornithine deacetylase n=1 Tax=Granulosicoccus antarcticus TaxID=437505 RepID=UPI00197AB521|nr:acetylornithine deacetylase [Granulosicoccus antarcticus]
MKQPSITSLEILSKLIAFDTTSREPNKQLIHYVETLLGEHGIQTTIIPNEDGSKANLYCTVGPTDRPGVMLSGHTDVVPVDGQAWTRPAFEMTESDNRVYGRGTTDMKGFVACSLAAMINASRSTLATPMHLGLSYDEEIGCVGVQSLLEMLRLAPVKPAMCIVGEPTSMRVATRHKGKMSILVRCIGREGHSALAPNALNAIHLACDLVQVIRDAQLAIQQASQDAGDPSEIPYTTIHVGRIVTDQALNIVPNLCTVNFEIRYPADTHPEELLDSIKQSASNIVAAAREIAPEADMQFSILNAYPSLHTPDESPVVQFVKTLVGANTTTYVAFGTEGGLFSEKVGIPTVVCGPGSMDQGHKPDEYIELEQLDQCDTMLNKLVEFLAESTLDQIPS